MSDGHVEGASDVHTPETHAHRQGCDRRRRGSRRIDPDDGRFIRLVVGGVVLAGVVAFAISFTALYEVASWLGLPPSMWWAVPVFIDLAILVYAASVLVHKARGERTLASWAALGTFTALSVFANAAHAWSYAQNHDQRWQGVVGAVVAGMVPVAIFVATEQLSRVAVENPESRRNDLRKSARMEQDRAEHERQLAHLEFAREQQAREVSRARAMAQQAAELDQERHRTAVAKLQADRDREVQQSIQPLSTPHSPGVSQPGISTNRPSLEAPPPETPKQRHSPVVESGRSGSSVTNRKSGSALDEVAEFVAAKAAEGVKVSAAMLAEQFRISERTGRRRLQQLRDDRPEAFFPAADELGREQP
ncbi:DUF2637 domain-containing protein [Citricoccus sp. SGAir0253]|nr:DUF2637 domain-containing protein [Citricoccus sp. SGAir0253]